jgi:excinuclease UvrABC ATPase subunit
MRFGQSSEKLAHEIEQLEMELDELQEDEGVRAAERPAAVQVLIEKPYRKPLPEHLPRQEEVHEPSCTCPNCGGAMRRLGEDVTEVLQAQGKTAAAACNEAGTTEQTYYRWRKEYGGMGVDQAKKLKQLESENGRLKKLVADLSLEKQVFKDIAEGNL